jgi:hypothetical protein
MDWKPRSDYIYLPLSDSIIRVDDLIDEWNDEPGGTDEEWEDYYYGENAL